MEIPEPVEGDVQFEQINLPVENDKEVRLSKGIDMGQLQSGGGVEFQIDEDQFKEELQNQYSEMAEDYDGFDTLIDLEKSGDIMNVPFEELAKRMKDLSGDGGVLKHLIHQGVGEKIPQGAFAQVHYNGYIEGEDTPFDSSRIKNKIYRFRLGKENDTMKNVIWGLDMAVASMFKGEISRFLISPNYAFGKMGCPPRIPPNATLLYEVELLNFTDTVGMDEYYSLPFEERKEAAFELVQKIAEAHRKEGNDCFKRNYIHGAIRSYRKAIDLLHNCRMQSDEDEVVQQKMLVKTLQNIALCYMKEKMPKKCLSSTNEVIDMDRNNAKAFYLRGKALMQLAEFSRARTALNRALKLKPRDKDVLKAFEDLEKKNTKYNMDEKKLCAAMLGLQTEAKTGSAPTNSTYTEEFKKLISDQLQDFILDTELTEFPLKFTNFTDGEVQCIKDVVAENKLQLYDVGTGSNRHFKIHKEQKK